MGPRLTFDYAIAGLQQLGISVHDIAALTRQEYARIVSLIKNTTFDVPPRIAERVAKAFQQQQRRHEAAEILRNFQELGFTEIKVAKATAICVYTINRIIKRDPDQAVGPKLVGRLRSAFRRERAKLLAALIRPVVLETANSRGTEIDQQSLAQLAVDAVIYGGTDDPLPPEFPPQVSGLLFAMGAGWGIAANPSLPRYQQLRVYLHEIDHLRWRVKEELDGLELDEGDSSPHKSLVM
jgi:hypothetical protein